MLTDPDDEIANLGGVGFGHTQQQQRGMVVGGPAAGSSSMVAFGHTTTIASAAADEQQNATVGSAAAAASSADSRLREEYEGMDDSAAKRLIASSFQEILHARRRIDDATVEHIKPQRAIQTAAQNKIINVMCAKRMSKFEIPKLHFTLLLQAKAPPKLYKQEDVAAILTEYFRNNPSTANELMQAITNRKVVEHERKLQAFRASCKFHKAESLCFEDSTALASSSSNVGFLTATPATATGINKRRQHQGTTGRGGGARGGARGRGGGRRVFPCSQVIGRIDKRRRARQRLQESVTQRAVMDMVVRTSGSSSGRGGRGGRGDGNGSNE